MNAAIERIRRKLEPFEKQGWRLNPPLTRDAVEQFETDHQVQLPEAYRHFLLHLGDGIRRGEDASSVNPWLLPLSEWLYHMGMLPDEVPPGYLATPCCLTPEMIETPVWQEFLRSPQFERKFIDAQGREQEEKFHGCGMIAVHSCGCTYFNTLVVSGPQAGRIVYFAFEGDAPWFAPEADFLTWVERQLDEMAAGPYLGYVGWGPPGNEPQFLEASNDLPRAVFLRGLFRFDTLSAAAWDRVHDCLVHPESNVRERAMCGLKRWGVSTRELAALEKIGRSDPESWFRAEAIRLLVEHAEWCVQHLGFFETIAKSDPDEHCRRKAAGIVEAVYEHGPLPDEGWASCIVRLLKKRLRPRGRDSRQAR